MDWLGRGPTVLLVVLCTVLLSGLAGVLFVPSVSSDCAWAQPSGAPGGDGVVPPAGEKPPPPPGEQPAAPAPAAPARTTNTIIIVAVVVAVLAIVIALAMRKKPQ